MLDKKNNRKFKSALGNLKVAAILNDDEYSSINIFTSVNDKPNNKFIERLRSILSFILLLIFISFILFARQSHAASRIKDIVYFEGIRENTLVGYGIVVGLNGTGDNLKNAPFTEKGLNQFLSKIGINSAGTTLKTKNVAAVTITGNLPAFARSGSKFNISISTLGDAKSLEGGTLLAAPMLGADGKVYAVAQGQIAVGGLITSTATSNASSKGVPTNGYIANGASVEREIDFDLESLSELKLALRNPDLSTARRVSESINEVVGEDASKAIDPGTVVLKVPAIYGKNVVGLLSDIEQIIIVPDHSARVVIDESSGTIVIGEDVKIDTVAVAQGNLMVSVTSDSTISEQGFASDQVLEQTAAPVNNNKRAGNGLAVIKQGASLRDLIAGLNALGVGTRDLITILQTIKSAGALHADITTK
jgi:flagellar P-ring protein precursor FlgI